MSDRLDAFLAMLKRGQDSALLRYSLGNEYLAEDEPDNAIEHLSKATEIDRNYSAAWKLLGKALEAADRDPDAAAAYRDGIEIAADNGDHQAAKEMTVFLKRIEKRLAAGS